MELTNYFIDILGTLSDYLTGQSQLYFFRYFSLFSFTSLWKTLCKVKDLWGADLTQWTVSMKEGSEISHVTCCTIQMQIGSCNINCLNQFCKSCKFGGPGKRAAPVQIGVQVNGGFHDGRGIWNLGFSGFSRTLDNYFLNVEVLKNLHEFWVPTEK